jgi:hypothetical protein
MSGTYYNAWNDIYEDARDIQNNAARKIQQAFRKPYLLNVNGTIVTDPILLEPILKNDAIFLNKKWYSKQSLKEAIKWTGAKVPHSSRLLTENEMQKISDPHLYIYILYGIVRLYGAPELRSKHGAMTMWEPGVKGDTLVIRSGGNTIVLYKTSRVGYIEVLELSTRKVLAEVSVSEYNQKVWEDIIDKKILPRLGSPTSVWQIEYISQMSSKQQKVYNIRSLSNRELAAFVALPYYDYHASLWNRARLGGGAPDFSIFNGNDNLINNVPIKRVPKKYKVY